MSDFLVAVFQEMGYTTIGYPVCAIEVGMALTPESNYGAGAVENLFPPTHARHAALIY